MIAHQGGCIYRGFVSLLCVLGPLIYHEIVLCLICNRIATKANSVWMSTNPIPLKYVVK